VFETPKRKSFDDGRKKFDLLKQHCDILINTISVNLVQEPLKKKKINTLSGLEPEENAFWVRHINQLATSYKLPFNVTYDRRSTRSDVKTFYDSVLCNLMAVLHTFACYWMGGKVVGETRPTH
jgi:hypothetical protein